MESFKTALAFVGVTAEDDEVECMLANMIAQVTIVYYVSDSKILLRKGIREKNTIVLIHLVALHCVFLLQ